MLDLIKEIQALAQTGLHYTKDEFDKERYVRLRQIAFEMMAQSGDFKIEDVQKFFLPENGYATPKVDLRACVIRENKVLLVKERSDGRWTLPGGWADQNESPIEGIVREVKEESGFDVRVLKLYAVKDRDRHAYHPKYPVSLFKLFFVAEIIGGEATETLECSEVEFFDLKALPELSIDRVLEEDIEQGFAAYKSPSHAVYCD